MPCKTIDFFPGMAAWWCFGLALASAAADPLAENRRSLASEGCDNCCFKHDCSLAFAKSQAGVCCGAHPARGQTGCCPLGASCVHCANIWKCSRSRYVSRASRCHICADDIPPECHFQRGYYGGGGMVSSLLFICAKTLLQGRRLDSLTGGIHVPSCSCRQKLQKGAYASG